MDQDCDGSDRSCDLLGTYDLYDDRIVRIEGENLGDRAGYYSHGAGDVNGDGLDDVLIGAPYTDAGGVDAGAAYLLYSPITTDLVLPGGNVKLSGQVKGGQAGLFVNSAGDIDIDGFGDVLVSALCTNSSSRCSPGAGWILHGPLTGDSTLLPEDADIDAVVYAAMSADADGDGRDDLVFYDTESIGTIYYGPDATGSDRREAEIYQAEAGPKCCYVTDAGDVSGDGVADLLVGSGGDDEGGENAGAAFLLLGPITTDTDIADAGAKLVGTEADDEVGLPDHARILGDDNGDGYDDMLFVTSHHAGYTGAAWVVRGPVTGEQSLSAATATITGGIVGNVAGASEVGDVDGDECDDIAIGTAPYSDVPSSTYVFYGPLAGVGAVGDGEVSLRGETSSDGMTQTFLGDADADGHDDLLIGASNFVDGIGAVYIGTWSALW